MVKEFECKELLFITDVHLAASSNVRVDEDYAGTILNKLKFCIDYANSKEAIILIGGDLVNTPSLPLVVVNRLIDVLSQAKNPIIDIVSNHELLFNNLDNIDKTVVGLLDRVGLITYSRYETYKLILDGKECVLTNTRLNKDCGKPQVIVYHGFLNKIDDRNTFLFEDVPLTDNSIVLLGHDHVPYEPVPYNNSTIHRPGSVVRAIRNDSENRTPQMVRIKWSKKKDCFIYQYVDIPCPDSSLIFKEKRVKGSANIEQDYTELLNNLKSTKAKDITLQEALKVVTRPEVVAFIDEILLDYENKIYSK